MRLNDWVIFSPSGREYRLSTSLFTRLILNIPHRLKYRLRMSLVLWPTMSRDVPCINLSTPTRLYALPPVTDNVYETRMMPRLPHKHEI